MIRVQVIVTQVERHPDTGVRFEFNPGTYKVEDWMGDAAAQWVAEGKAVDPDAPIAIPDAEVAAEIPEFEESDEDNDDESEDD